MAAEEKPHPHPTTTSRPLLGPASLSRYHHGHDCTLNVHPVDQPMMSRPGLGTAGPRRSQHKLSIPAPASDKLVWFAPVSSPLLSSPARDPAKGALPQMGSKKMKAAKKGGATPRKLSIFSNSLQQQQQQQQQQGMMMSGVTGGGALVAIEAEEPTSPKVSCMGQVKSSCSISKSKDQGFSSAGGEHGCRAITHIASSGGSMASGGLIYPCVSGSSPSFSSPATNIALPPPSASSASAPSLTKSSGYSKWGSLIFGGSRKESNSSKAAAPPNEAAPAHDLGGSIQCQDHKPRSIWTMPFRRNQMHTKVGGIDSSHQDDGIGGDMKMQRFQDTVMESDFDRTQCAQHGPQVDGDVVKHIKSTYDQLPSLLQSGTNFNGQNLKVSLEVVPETWLLRDGQRFRADGRHIPDKKNKTSGNGELPARSIMGRQDSAAPLDGSVVKETNKGANTASLKDSFNKETDAGGTFSIVHSLELEGSQPNVVPSCPGADNGCNGNDAYVGVQRTQLNHVEKQRCALSVSSDLKRGQSKSRRAGLATEDSLNDRNNLCSADYSGCKAKTHISPSSSFSTLILVGYNLNEDMGLDDCEKVLNGAFGVSRLSVDGTSQLLRLLKEGEAEFIRSRSATSHGRRALIGLQRCNSEPSKNSQKNGY